MLTVRPYELLKIIPPYPPYSSFRAKKEKRCFHPELYTSTLIKNPAHPPYTPLILDQTNVYPKARERKVQEYMQFGKFVVKTAHPIGISGSSSIQVPLPFCSSKNEKRWVPGLNSNLNRISYTFSRTQTHKTSIRTSPYQIPIEIGSF